MSPRGGTRSAQADAGINFKHYVEIAQTAERGKFDMIFLADNVCVREAKMEALSRSAQYIANFEPITLISALAGVTERIGLTCTAIDELQRAVPRRAQVRLARPHQRRPRRLEPGHLRPWRRRRCNFGRDAHYGHAERYERANEFAEIVTALWDSWDDDAFMRDKESGQFFDPAKLHCAQPQGQALQGARAAQHPALAAGPSGDRAGRHLRRRHGRRGALRRGDLQRAPDDGILPDSISRR